MMDGWVFIAWRIAQGVFSLGIIFGVATLIWRGVQAHMRHLSEEEITLIQRGQASANRAERKEYERCIRHLGHCETCRRRVYDEG